jgi:hypothetical protein
MANERTDNYDSLRSKIKDRLEKVRQEIDELSLKYSLGKSEATDKFRELKKDFLSEVNEWKITGEQFVTSGKEKTQSLKSKLEELQLQLALGKSEAKELFSDQKKKIMKSIAEIEAELKKKK